MKLVVEFLSTANYQNVYQLVLENDRNLTHSLLISNNRNDQIYPVTIVAKYGQNITKTLPKNISQLVVKFWIFQSPKRPQIGAVKLPKIRLIHRRFQSIERLKQWTLTTFWLNLSCDYRCKIWPKYYQNTPQKNQPISC